MLKLHIPPLDEQHQADLQALQDTVNQQADYVAQVAYAKEHWRKKPAALFARLKPQLAALLSGNGRCVYCEDSWADEIEHMRPQGFLSRANLRLGQLRAGLWAVQWLVQAQSVCPAR